MALLHSTSTCVLCGEPLDREEGFFATWGCAFPPEHPLFPFCDAPMHWPCYEVWEHRLEFARAYFQGRSRAYDENPHWGLAYESDRFLIAVSHREVSLHFAAIGSSERLELGAWEGWLRDLRAATEEMPALVQRELTALWPLLQQFPHADALLARVDWDAKEELLQQQEKRERHAAKEALSKTRLSNRACVAELRAGPHCPHCRERREVRYIRKGGKVKSYFICHTCHRSFGPAESEAARNAAR